MQEFSVTPRWLTNWLEREDAPALIDVRQRASYQAAPDTIPGAIWRDPFAVGEWASELSPQRDVVVFCGLGHEVGRAARDLLAALGYRAWYLAGGLEKWKATGGPTALTANIARQRIAS